MSGHATINRLYRLVWSDAQGAWVAVAETTRGRGKQSGRSKLLAALFAGLATGTVAQAGAPPVAIPGSAQLPTGGQVVGGALVIGQQGATMTVTQASERGAIDWQTFNVGSQAQVNFVQPSRSAVTLNRVLDTQASQIYGRINANGQVFLSNPNGVYFSASSSVDVGGLIATTHSIDNVDFMAGDATFERKGATGSVINDGQLSAAIGGYIALLAPEVRNNGVVLAQAGTVALVSGEAISLQFDARQSLVGVLATPMQIDALVENGNAVRAPGGMIVMSAQAARQLQDGVVRNSGTLEASSLVSRGGKIVLDSSGLVDNGGTVAASNGGQISIAADRMLNAGALRADGGGTISATLGGLVETASATVSATGGMITVDTGAGLLYSSGRYDATGLAGQRGGSVTLTGASVALMGAQVDVSGDAGGGSIRVGGDFHGSNPLVRNATTTSIGTGVTLAADALVNGDGGKVVVWSDVTTRFAGNVTARAGVAGGNGGQLEVSGKQQLYFSGSGDAHAPKGTAGELLLDPKDIYIDAELSGQKEFIDPHPTVGGTFGSLSVPLSTKSGTTTTSSGYVVVTNPTDNLGATSAGAAYLFRASDQALISTLYGNHANDKVGGTSVTALNNGNFVVLSKDWDSGKGAATWGNGVTGWGAGATAVSSANSLVGSRATFNNTQGTATSDGARAGIKLLDNGNYLVTNSGWNDSRGAVTFGNGATGTAGVVSAANSLVGSTAMSNIANEYVTYKNGDQIGSSIQALANGNYVVQASSWNKGVGAIALGSGSTGLIGTVGTSTALVGDSSRFDATGYGSNTDQIGGNFTLLTGSQFITYQSGWKNGAGAITAFDGVTPIVGLVSASNSMVGAAGESLSSGGVSILANQSAYVINSPNWSGSRGAVTYVPFASNAKDLAIASNSVTGASAGDAIGSVAVTVLANQDYVISSPSFNGMRGASTLVDGSTGKTKVGQGSVVGAANSLVGSQANDQVGAKGIVALTGNGNYVTLSPYWSNGSNASAGAVTWSSGSSPTVGAVSTSNSLVGSAANDRVGAYKHTYYSYNDTTAYQKEGSTVTALVNGNYAVASPMFNGSRGAVTWNNGATGATVDGGYTITAANSLLGSVAGDFVGGLLTPVDQITNASNNTTTHYDAIGNGLTALANGNFVTASTYWNNGATAKVGAVTWSDGAGSPTLGNVSTANSLVGSTANDMVGMGKNQGNGISLLQSGFDSAGKATYSGNYVVTSALWDNGALADAGAVTWRSGTAPSTGTISNSNSVVGVKASDVQGTSTPSVPGWTITPLANNGNYLIINSYWNNGAALNAGAVTWVDGSSGRVTDYAANGNTNVVSAANSLVGTRSTDRVGSSMTYLTSYDSTAGINEATGNYLVRSTLWNNGALTTAGAITWGSGTSGVAGVISSGNSILGQKTADTLGNTSSFLSLSNGNYVVANKNADIDGVVNAGAVALVDGSTGRLTDYAARGNQNIFSSTSSMVGSHTDDKVGSTLLASADYGPKDKARPGYFIASIAWNCLAGAVTYVDDASHAAVGVVSAGNSAVGNPNETFFGGLTASVKIGLNTSNTAYVTFGGGTGRVLFATSVMPVPPQMLMPNLAAFVDAQNGIQAMTPDYVAAIMRTGTRLTLQANNDIFIKSGIDASGGTAGGGLSLQAGRSVTVLGNIVTGNRDLTIVANESVANGVQNASRDDGIATISMGKNPAGQRANIDAGTGAVSINMAAGTDKTYNKGGSISLNDISASTISVVNNGNGLGTGANLPSLAINCCGFDLGYRGAGADVVLNAGAVLRATGTGTAVTLAAKDKFTNNSGSGAIINADSTARWLVYAAAPGTSTFGNLDSGSTAIWNTGYTGSPVAQTGNRYLFQYQPTVTVGTQNVSKTYGDDVTSSLTSSVVSLYGAQAAVAGAYLGDTLASALSGTVVATSNGAAATAAASATPYAISVDLSGVTGNNGYAVALGSNTGRTLTVNKKALTVTANDAAKTYDGTAYQGGNGVTVAGLANNEAAAVLGGTLIYGGAAQGAVNVGSYALSASGYSASNYTFAYVNGQLVVNARPLAAVTANLVGAIGKVYDGNTSATLGSANFNLSGFATGEGATVTRTVGSYDSRNAGARTVTATLSSGDFSANSGTQLSNYTLPTTASGSATITARSITLTAPTISKTYDGGLSYSVTAGNLTAMNASLVGGDVVSSAAIVFTDKNAGAGNRTVSLNSATVNDGNNGANYAVTLVGSSTGTITPRTLHVSATGSNRVYDAGLDAAVTLQDDRLEGDALTLSNASATFADKNAGTGKAITVAGIGKTGTDSANYVLASTSATASANIARAELALGGVTAVNRAYDTGTSVALGGTPTVNALGNDVVFIGGSASGTIANKNVGVNKAVTVGGYTITDTNYTLVQPSAVTVDIAPAVLALGGLQVATTKTYDGSAAASLSGAAVVSGMNGEQVSVLGNGTGQFADANAGTAKIVTVAGFTSSDSNYVIGQQAGLTGAIAQAPLMVSINGVSKVYDGAATAQLDGGNFSVSGLIGGETIGVNQSSGLFDSKNAGARTVDSLLNAGNFVADNGVLLSNYVLPASASGAALITPKSVTLSTPSVSKVYDGALGYTTAAGDLTTLSAALVGGDAVSAASFSFTDKNAGAGNRGVLFNSATVNDGNNGANYTVTLAGSSTGTITPRTLHVSATGSNRVYDAGLDAAVTLGDDRVTGDVLAVSNTGAQFTDKNAGNGKTVVVSGLGKTGTDSANYVLASDGVTTTADIARAALAVTGVTAVGRAYDTGLVVGIAGTPTVQALGDDVVFIGGSASGTIANKNVGVNKAVTVGGYTITDTNYTLVQPSAVTVDIAPAVLALGGLQVATTKTYDGSAAASLSGAAVVSGMNGEQVSVLGNGTGQFADANAGTAKTVTVAGFTSSDSNYVIGQQAGLTGAIAQAPLTVSINGVSKVYDGAATAQLDGGNFSVSGLIGGETIGVNQSSGLFDSKNAGARTVDSLLNADNFVADSGVLLSNYLLPASASGAALITQKSVTLSTPSVSKVYDGALGYTTAAGDLTTLSAALVGGDAVSAASFSFTDKNAGAGNRGVLFNSASVNDGNNGANYTVTLAGSSTGTITPRTLHVSATGSNRVYDAGLDAAVTLGDDRVTGDVLAVSNTSAQFTDKNAGNGKTVVVSGLGKTGTDSANYVLASDGVTTTADIARAALAVTGVTAVGRAYDTGLGVAIVGTPTVQALGDDVVTIQGSAVGTLADKNAGQDKQVSVSGYSIDDANYRLVAPAGVTVNITPAVLALNGFNVATTKTYDGSRNATLVGVASVTGLNGEVVSVSGNGTGQFADKNVGSGKAITVSGLQASDSNYAIGQQASLVGSIAPASLVVTGVTANDKLFDGLLGATLTGTARVNPVAGDIVTVGGAPVASFASADAGIGKAVTVNGYTLAGADAGNYSVVRPSGLTATINADASLVPPPVVVVTAALPTPPLTVQIADTAPAPAAVTVVAPNSAAPAITASGIVVSLVREPAPQQGGMVTVMVPKALAEGAVGFNFPLPAQLVETAAVNREQVIASTTAGAPLPSWLAYDNASKTFTAVAAPDGSLPIQVMLTIGVQQVVIVIAQSAQ